MDVWDSEAMRREHVVCTSSSGPVSLPFTLIAMAVSNADCDISEEQRQFEEKYQVLHYLETSS